MFASNRCRYATGCILLTACAYAIATVALQVAANWAEREAGAHPYWGAENPLRYLTPSRDEASREVVMLMGASAAEEALLVDDFASALPEFRVIHGAFSSATLDDVLVALNYLERAYGAAAFPKIIVLGIDHRLVANWPRRFGRNRHTPAYAYFLEAIESYSWYSPHATATGTILVEKPWRGGLAARLDFYVRKQQPRYRAALATIIDGWVNGPRTVELQAPPLPEPYSDALDGWHRRPLHVRSLLTWKSYLREAGAWNAFCRWSREFAAPQNHQYRRRASLDSVRQAMDWEANQFHWNPHSEPELLAAQFEALRNIVHAHGTKAYLVNLPIHPCHVERRIPENYSAYVQVVREGLPEFGWVDLADEFDATNFQDGEHVDRSTAKEITRRVIEYILQSPSASNGAPIQ